MGNNIPIFFIRDGYQFPDLVHSLRPNPKTHIQEGWRILDFLSSKPESCAMARSHAAEPCASNPGAVQGSTCCCAIV